MTATAAVKESETKRITQYAALAEKAIDEHEKAVKTLCDVTNTLSNLESQRAWQKTAAILRLCQLENPATPGKPYSASQAGDFAQLDPDYAKYKLQVQSFTLLKQEAEGNLATARLAAQFAIALVRSTAGLT